MQDFHTLGGVTGSQVLVSQKGGQIKDGGQAWGEIITAASQLGYSLLEVLFMASEYCCGEIELQQHLRSEWSSATAQQGRLVTKRTQTTLLGCTDHLQIASGSGTVHCARSSGRGASSTRAWEKGR